MAVGKVGGATLIEAWRRVRAPTGMILVALVSFFQNESNRGITDLNRDHLDKFQFRIGFRVEGSFLVREGERKEERGGKRPWLTLKLALTDPWSRLRHMAQSGEFEISSFGQNFGYHLGLHWNSK